MSSLCYLIFLLLILVHSPFLRSSSTHALTKGSSLSVENKDDILVSRNGVFTAGFYPVGVNAYCFSIWFSEPVENGNVTIVWMANRDVPVNGKLSKLSLWENGNLVLKDADESIVWSKETKTTTASLQLQLHNTGNLVLESKGDKRPLWQSFDHPTDTLLPNQPFTRDSELVSSTSLGNFSSGFFKVYFDNDNVLSLLYNGREITSVYWPSPYLKSWEAGRSTYNNTRIATLDSHGQFDSSDHFGFFTKDFGAKSLRILKLDLDGNLRVYSLVENKTWEVQWQAFSEPCKIHGVCGPNSLCTYSPEGGRKCACLHGYKQKNRIDWSYGCEPEFKPCGQDNEDGFVELRSVEFYGYDIQYLQNHTLEACKKECLNDCDCKGFQFKFDAQGYYNCYLKNLLYNGYQYGFDNSMHIKLPKSLVSSFQSKFVKGSDLSCPGSPPVIKLQRSYEEKHGTGSIRFMLWFGCSVGGLEILCVVFFLVSICKSSEITATSYFPVATGFKRFTYAELKKATRNFSEEIGRGGAGVVYKGILSDERIAAIKLLKAADHQGEAEFQAEISTIGRINHMNLIETWGYCVEGKHRLVVYEYMENGSLANNLNSNKLDWEKKLEIAMGTAKGLAYLHEECLEWVLHCDVKPHNILLDANYNPKVADFGLSKLFDRTRIENSSFSRIRGTRGYMAPEWVLNLPITSKVDVYSYGVVILEMVTGKSPLSMQQMSVGDSVKEQTLIEWVREKIHELKGSGCENWIEEIVDGTTEGEYDEGSMRNLVRVALQCAEEDRVARPSMSQVVDMLLHPEIDD